jgi:YD repeat-containing protein
MKFEYLNGLLAKVTDTFNREYFYEYNANNKLSSVTDFKGNKVLFDYYNGST